MLLTAFIVAQLVFDLAVLALVVVTLVGRAGTRRVTATPWEGSDEFLALAEDLVGALESLPDRGETRGDAPAPPVTATAPVTAPSPREAGSALGLLRAGVAADEVARRFSLSAAELGLLTSVAEAQGRPGVSIAR